ncbi:hypothetical protein NQD34_008818, partial [Periophthalmus magnuspinnatus]
ETTDIMVSCGTEFIELTILLCPLYYDDYNESMLMLNNQSRPECTGTTDLSATPPVIRYTLSISDESVQACDNNIQIIDRIGTGAFSDFSNIQYVTISGMVATFDPTASLITYKPTMTYLYSCTYPLEYFLNNTQLVVAGSELAINQNNGSFLSSLKFNLYKNEFYNESLIIPKTGLPLKTPIYAEVSASSLTDRFNVLLSWCKATVEPYTAATEGYNLFVGCEVEPHTTLGQNGVSDKARFVFQAFRFVQHKNRTVSEFYLHCYSSLCEKDECASKLPNCTGGGPTNRKRREATDSNGATITSPAIIVSTPAFAEVPPTKSGNKGEAYSRPLVAVIVCLSILALLTVVMGACFIWTVRRKAPLLKHTK